MGGPPTLSVENSLTLEAHPRQKWPESLPIWLPNGWKRFQPGRKHPNEPKFIVREDIMLNPPKLWGTYLKRPYFE